MLYNSKKQKKILKVSCVKKKNTEHSELRKK